MSHSLLLVNTTVVTVPCFQSFDFLDSYGYSSTALFHGKVYHFRCNTLEVYDPLHSALLEERTLPFSSYCCHQTLMVSDSKAVKTDAGLRLVDLDTGESKQLLKEASHFHARFGLGLLCGETLLLVGGEKGKRIDSDEDDMWDGPESPHNPAYRTIKEISLATGAVKKHSVLPHSMNYSTVIPISAHEVLLLCPQVDVEDFFAYQRTESSSSVYLFDIANSTLRLCGKVPDGVTRIRSWALCSESLYLAVGEEEVIECNLRSGMGRRIHWKKAGERYRFLWILQKRMRQRLPIGLVTVITLQFV